MSALPGPNWVYYAAAIALALIGLTLLWRAIFRSYDRRRPICPKCRYDLSGLAEVPFAGRLSPITCPECGGLVRNLRIFARRPRRFLRFSISIIVLAAAAYLLAVPLNRYGLWKIVPLSAQTRLHSVVGWGTIESLDARLVEAILSRELNDAQSTALVESFPGLARTRRAWPRDTPLHLAFENDPLALPRVGSLAVKDLSAPLRTENRKRLAKNFDPLSCPIEIIKGDQTKWVVVPLVIDAINTHRVLPPMPLPIRWVNSMDEAITPVRGEAADRVARAVFRVRVAAEGNGLVVGLRPTAVDQQTASLVPADTTFAVRVELIHAGVVLASTRLRTRAREVWEEHRFAPFPYGDEFHTLSHDLSILATAGAVFRFTTDDEMALTDFDAGHYWRGSIDVPVEEIFGNPVK